jgi:3-oxoacyl-[acyl-carrier protein] reductase
VMIPQRSGKIINISSGAGISGSISSGVQYPASKAGVIGLTKALAGDLAPLGINVNCITPGLILTWDYDKSSGETGWTPEKIDRWIKLEVPVGRIGHPNDIADVILFLASDAARYIVGEVIRVDGGASLSTVAKRDAFLEF